MQARTSFRHTSVTAAAYLGLGVLCIFVLYPLFWIFISAFKTRAEIFANPWGLPGRFRFQNLAEAWQLGNFGRVLVNSFLVTTASVMLAFVCAVPAAYFFLVGQFRGKFLYYPIVLSLVIPVVSLVIPLAFLTSTMGIIDTYWALIFPYAALHMPLCMFLLREFFSTVPNSMREAAFIDGATEFEALVRIVLPISKPAIYSTITLLFIFIWNEFTLGEVLVTEPEFFTIPVGLNAFTGSYSYEYHLVFSTLLMVNLPLIVVLIFLQRHFVKGILVGALKQ